MTRRRPWSAAAILLLLLVPLAGCGRVDADPRGLTREEWAEDLAYLAKKLPAKHGNAFHQVSRADFEAAVAELDRRLPDLEAHQVLVEMGRIVALVGDGHTELWLNQEATGFARLPIALYRFGEELYVAAATEEHLELLGRRVVAFGGVPAREAWQRVVPLIGRDNEYELLRSAPVYLALPDVLHAVGLSRSRESAEVTLAGPQGESTIALSALGDGETVWKNAREAGGAEAPLSARRPERWHWYEYLPESRTVYVNYDHCNNQPGQPSIKRFARELFAFVDANPVERMVVDLRRNTGGNFHRNEPLVDGIRRRPALRRPGALFVLTGRTTFSAAMVAAADLRRLGAVLVGEPSRSRPNGYTDNEQIWLPNSRVLVEYSELHREVVPELGDAPYLPVDLAVSPTFDDYRAGRDPVLAAALAYDGE